MFTRAIVRTPGQNAANGLTTAQLGTPDHARLLTQHETYVRTLESLGLKITHLDPLPGHPDAYFVEDAALMFPELAVVTRPGAPARLAEAEVIAPTVATFREVIRLTAPATLDGGDVLVVGKRVFVGISERTNPAGADQLATILKPHGYSVISVAVPAGLHLKSSVTSAGDDVLVLTESLRGEFDGFRHVVVPNEEAYSANVLWINGSILLPDGFPRTLAKLQDLRLPLRVLDQSEVQKMDGALTCLSLRF